MATASTRRPYAPRMPPEQRREQLLDAALRVIAAEGYGGVTIEAIAREAGVTRPVVYGPFENLGELLHALFERQEQRALSQIAEAVPADFGDRDTDEAIVDGIHAFLLAVASDPNTWRPILLPPESTPAVVRERVDRNRAQILRRLEQLAAWGLERRGGPAGLDIELLARTILVAGEEAGRLVLTDPDRYPPERLKRYAAAMLAAAPRG
jgi:AcrR family transcriptional regulator